MFDAKSILNQIMRGGAQKGQNQETGGAGGLEDLLSQLGVNVPGGDANAGGQAQGGGGGFSLDDLARNFGGQQGSDGAGSSSGSGIGDLLNQLQQKGGDAGSDGGQGGGILGQLGAILGQATDGVREGAGRIGEATGAGQAIENVTGGKSGADLMSQLQEFMANNKLGTGVALGGLGALVLGTQTGRSLAGSAAKVGAAALIGGLAYKAYQNYQAGKPLISDGSVEPEPAPEGSGFEEQTVSNDDAIRYIRAMIAAAASDGRIDADEQQRIIGTLSESGMDAEAEEFLARELNSPATIDDLTAGVTKPEDGLRIYTAARVAIDPDTDAEQTFLAILASRLGIDDALAQHIDQTARNAAA